MSFSPSSVNRSNGVFSSALSRVGSFFIGIHWGVMGVAVAYAVATGIGMLLTMHMTLRCIALPARDFLCTMARPLLCAGLMLVCVLGIRVYLHVGTELGAPMRLLSMVVVGVVVYVALSLVLNREQLLALWDALAQACHRMSA